MKVKQLKKASTLGVVLALLFAIFNCTTDETKIRNSLESISTQNLTETTRIEAENYSSMLGIRTQATSDINGEENVGWINNGDWLRFDSIDLSNVSSISTRIASATDGGILEVRTGSTNGNLIGSINIPNTGAWQVWETISGEIDITEGTYDLYLVFIGDTGYLFNINWFDLNVENESTLIYGEVDPSLFIEEGLVSEITTETRTLSNGTSALCYVINTYSTPTDHEMGPWCPTNINDDASKGGIWLENGEVNDVDGAFIENMSTFYNDSNWQMYDSEGNIYVTETLEDCINAANPNVGDEYANFCVECLPSHVTEITNTYILPVVPVKLDRSNPIRGSRGLAFNGVVFDAPAPTDAILGAYTLAPFDDAGGHINVNAGYHYHTSTGLTKTVEQEDEHAGLIGYAMDGFGMYEHLNTDESEPADLDGCRGHEDYIRGYHYHVAAPGENSFIDCFFGATAN